MKTGRTKEKIQISEAEDFENIRKKLIRDKRNFEYVSSGSVSRIKYMGKEFIKCNTKEFAGKGHHISTMFRKGVEEWLKKNRKKLKPYTKDYKEQMFCLGHIEEAIGRPLSMIDISGCYWQTAYKLGYMSREVYISARRKKEWKTGRNAAIGGLCKREYITPYKEGRPLNELRSVVEPKKEFQYIRNHIIGYVYQKFFHFYEVLLRRKFYMFLTDSVVTTPSMAREVKKQLWMDGYLSTEKTIEFRKVDRKKRIIYWWDYTAPVEEENEKGEKVIVGYGVERYYQYAEHQVLPDMLGEVLVDLRFEMENEESDSDGGSFCSPACSLHFARTGEIRDCCLRVAKVVEAGTEKEVTEPGVLEAQRLLWDLYRGKITKKALYKGFKELEAKYPGFKVA